MVTAKDIAKEAGVSRPTVSLVLSGRYQRDLKISEAVAERVKAAARKLNYHRNAVACSMRSGKTNVVGFLGDLGEVGNSYMMAQIDGMTDALQKNNYLLKLFSLKENNFHELCDQCVEQRLAGVICRTTDEELLEYLHIQCSENKIPVVLLGNSIHHDWCPRVVTDAERGMELAVDHLVQTGCRRIGYVNVTKEMGLVIARKKGFLRAMKKHKGKIENAGILDFPFGFTMQKEHYVLLDEFYRESHPDALVCVSDTVAMKVEVWAYSRNIRIPENLAVTGFANLDFAMLAVPPLTTIAQPIKEMGIMAAETVLQMAQQDEATADDVVLPVELIIRDSTAKIKHQKRITTEVSK